MSEQKMIDVTDYCNNRCKCCNEYCDKSSCPILKAPTIDPETLPIVKELREKLSFYENLPNEGDTLYHVVPSGILPPMVSQDTISEVVKNKDGWFVVYYWRGIRASIPASQIGKTIFLTREEAENALKERENDENT